MTSEILAARAAKKLEDVAAGRDPTTGENTRVVGFVRAQTTEPKVAPPVHAAEANPDEIDIADDSSSEEEQPMEAVQAPDQKIGAKDRFKRKRAEEAEAEDHA